MNVSEMVQRAGLEVKTAADRLDAEVTGGYAADLLSTVMANAKEGNVWVTWHVHPNIVAIAVLAKLTAIILVSGRQPEQETLEKAEQEGVVILISKCSAFETVGRLYELGISGAQ
ncbi:MAG: serine kinase [Planctomycetia bacterium]|nr:serine kinase [Planctomycetia bacterium]